MPLAVFEIFCSFINLIMMFCLEQLKICPVIVSLDIKILTMTSLI